MPRAGWVKPVSDRRLSDLVSVGVLTRVFPVSVVDEVIAGAGRTERRHRSLPARVMAYFSIGMALFSEGSYEDVLELMTDGLAWSCAGGDPMPIPSKSAIFQARARLGFEPLRDLFARVACPLAAEGARGAWVAGLRVMAIDGTSLEVADTVANAEFFGYPESSCGDRAAFPQARVVALAECGTRAIVDAEVGPYLTSEVAMARDLATRLQPGTLVLADRGLYGFGMWQRACATGADLLWRVKSTLRPRHVQDLPDGSWLADIAPTSGPGWRTVPPIRVRIIEYRVDDHEPYRLLTTLLDHERAPAIDLAAAYRERWEIETAFDELKTHQRSPRTILRSKSPDLVLQEIWGHLCCHYSIRVLMHEAATHSGHDPDRISFTKAVRIARLSTAQGDFPPSRP